MSQIRTFIAVEIDAGVQSKAAAIIKLLSAASQNVRWVDPRNLHLTLCFLGNVDVLTLPAVCRAASDAVTPREPFEVEFAHVGAFPDALRPRTIWIDVTHGREELVALQGALEAELAALGFSPEHRKFQPHLTLGRVKQAGRGTADLSQAMAAAASVRVGGMSVSEVAVFSSRLDRGGPEYEALGHAELGGAR